MKIALNAQLLSSATSYRSAGVSNYSRHLLTALGQLAGTADGADLALTAFVNSAELAISGVRLRHTTLPLHHPLARIGWEQMILPLALQMQQMALVHGLVNVLPLATTVPGVVTVHDLSFARTPEAFPALKRWYLTRLCRASADKAQAVIAVSRQTADDLMTIFQLPAHKIHVIHNGIAAHFVPQPATAIAELRQRHQLPSRFFLYLGTLEPRKNLPLLIRAYARWRTAATPADRNVKLILAGGKGWFYKEIFQLVTELELTDHILFPGYIPAAELPVWYSAALAFIYPSRLEGFGLPVLEAMACGTPVLCSAIPSLREVAADYALFFPVDEELALADLLRRVLSEPTSTASLAQAGQTHAARFTWARAAAATVDCYRSL